MICLYRFASVRHNPQITCGYACGSKRSKRMARATGRLTALKVSRARLPGMYADGGGLYLQITEGGASWVYRYMLNGRAREMGLGPRALFGLQEARAKALHARRLRH